MLACGDPAPKQLTGLSPVRPTLVMLFKITCPVCQLTAPYLERLSKSTAMDVVGISQDDEEATAEFRDAFGVTFPTRLDLVEDDYPLSNAFGITHVPSLFVVEPDGKISTAVAGFSKRDLEALGRRAGVATFEQNDNVPQWKAG